MAINYDILTSVGTTDNRLKEIFTAKMPGQKREAALKKKDPAKLKAIEADVAMREKIEKQISGWLSEQIVFTLDAASLYGAVDMAWDSTPINRYHVPLMLYAQGRIDVKACASALKDIPGNEKYVNKNNGNTSINLPKFYEMNINLLRSVLTRRVAAQANKYNKLWPHFKYESRSTSTVGKLKADAISQRMDIMADQYDYRHTQTQVIRDMFLYGHCVEFPRCAWEREVQWEKADVAEEFVAGGSIRKRDVIVKEGVAWVNPHPGRVIYDNSYPLASINSDTGCEWIGYWDLERYGRLKNNADYFNRDQIGFTADMAGWFASYNTYFSQYFDKIKAPEWKNDMAAGNDRKNNVGLYSGEEDDTSVFLTELFIKVRPQEWGCGKYPHPVWVHLKVAGDKTVVYAEIMPSSPAVVTSYNENDSRLKNLSMAHELLGYQDQLTNLFTMLLETIKSDLFAVGILNEDVFPDTEEGKKVKETFKSTMAGGNFASAMTFLMTSFSDQKQLWDSTGGFTADSIFKIVRSSPNDKIGEIITAITSVIGMAERMMTLSSHEQGQPVEHEISATESSALSRSTDTLYDFIGQAVDEGRAAKKRIIYESLLAKGSKEVQLSVINRYPESVIAKAGFKVVERDEGNDEAIYATITGGSHLLAHDYIYTSRDGGDRPSGVEGANALAQWLTAIGQLPPEMSNAILSAMGKEKLFEIFNSILMMAGTGVDLKLETAPGESNALLPEQEQGLMQSLEQMGQILKANHDEIEALKQAVSRLTGGGVPPAAAVA